MEKHSYLLCLWRRRKTKHIKNGTTTIRTNEAVTKDPTITGSSVLSRRDTFPPPSAPFAATPTVFSDGTDLDNEGPVFTLTFLEAWAGILTTVLFWVRSMFGVVAVVCKEPMKIKIIMLKWFTNNNDSC